MKILKNTVLFALLALSATACTKEEITPEPTPTPAPPVPIGAIVLNCSYQNGVTLTNQNKNGVDYIVNCDVEILGGKLQIDTNVIIQFATNTSLVVKQNAYIEAVGTASKTIVFESNSGNNTSWKGIFIESDDTRNKLDYCSIKNGGTYSSSSYVGFSSLTQKANLYVFGKLAVTNSTISNSAGDGIFFGSESTALTFSNNIVSNNARYPITIYPPNLQNLSLLTCTFSANTNNQIGIYPVSSNKEVEFATLINKSPIPYFSFEDLNFNNNLDIKPGVTLIMASSKALTISGTWFIKVIGTSTEPIVIKGEVSSAGFWDGIFVNTNNSLNEFNYLNVSDGGNQPTATVSSIKANISVGSRVSSAQLKLSNTTSTNFTGCALAITGYSNTTTVVNNSTITIPTPCIEQ